MSSAIAPSPITGSISTGRRVQLALIVCLAAVAAYMWWPAKRPAPMPVRTMAYYETQFPVHSEQAWIASVIGHEIEEMAAAAIVRTGKNSSPAIFFNGIVAASQHGYFSGSIAGSSKFSAQLTLQPHYWEPDAYTPWVRAVLSGLNLRSVSSTQTVDNELAGRLTTPDAETLAREDQRISAALAKSPLDGALHEQAALLIGSFILRDAASRAFSDQRLPLCRMTAHLAMARALAERPGPAGHLASAILSALLGREASAFKSLAKLEPAANTQAGLSADAFGAWDRSLRMYLTGDYRLIHPPMNETLLERLEYLRALQSSISTNFASSFAQAAGLERLPEWGSRILNGGFSVGDGMFWIERTIPLEIDKCAALFRVYNKAEFPADDVGAALNQPWLILPAESAAAGRFSVLGWGAWADRFQRELCSLIEHNSILEGDHRANQEGADIVENELAKPFRNLDLFPLIRFYRKDQKQGDGEFLARARTVAQKNPLALPYERAHQAMGLALTEKFRKNPPTVPLAPTRVGKGKAASVSQPIQEEEPLLSLGSLYLPEIPAGTAFECDVRRNPRIHNEEQAKTLKAISPHNFLVAWEDMNLTTHYRPTEAEAREKMGPLMEYNSSAALTIADLVDDDPPKYAGIIRTLAETDPSFYARLGDYLVDAGDFDGAVSAYENMLKKSSDSVTVSNSVWWLVDRYLDQGRTGEARTVAERAAEVGSSGGIETMAWYLNRTGDLASAEAYYKATADRYPGCAEDLRRFYVRNRDKKPEFAEAAKAFEAEIFPSERERVSLSDLRIAPSDGVRVKLLSRDWAKRKKVKENDIIVALNGERVHKTVQWRFLRSSKWVPDVRLIVWRKDHYEEFDETVWPVEGRSTFCLEDFSTGVSR